MQDTYSALEPLIAKQIDACQIVPAKEARVDAIARHLLGFKPRYAAVSQATRVPILWLAPAHERESEADFTTYLGNGDPLSRRTVDVPRGRGPFADWDAGAIDSLVYDKINQVGAWTWERAIYTWIAWNGFGPLSHGKQSGYAWSGTSIYDGGKYVRDGVWSSATWDSQLGCYPIALRMAQLDSTLQLPRAAAPAPVAPADAPPALPGVGGAAGQENDAAWVQASLNRLGAKPALAVDGSFGRMTRRAVEAFQEREDIEVDGVVGPETVEKMKAELAKLPA